MQVLTTAPAPLPPQVRPAHVVSDDRPHFPNWVSRLADSEAEQRRRQWALSLRQELEARQEGVAPAPRVTFLTGASRLQPERRRRSTRRPSGSALLVPSAVPSATGGTSARPPSPCAVPSAASRVRWASAVPSDQEDTDEERDHDEEQSRPSSPKFDLGAAADQLTNREAADLVRQMLGSMVDVNERVQLLFCALQCVLEVEVEKVRDER